MAARIELPIDPLVDAVRAAGEAILAIRAEGCAVETKADDSPVTRADRAAEAILLEALARHVPGVPVVAEEQVAAGHVPAHGDTFFLVDALDGTRDFVGGGEDFTVNVGLIEGGVPTFGLIHVPIAGATYCGQMGGGAWRLDTAGRQIIAVRSPPAQPVVAVSKSHLRQPTLDYLADAFASEAHELLRVGSSLKFCLLAEGRADLYPRLSPTMEWDTAAGHALLAAAGGRVEGMNGGPLSYGKPDYRNAGFLATAGRSAPPVGAYWS